MNFAAVEKVAAAILYEGYMLYPYRPTSMKNRQRWNFGTLYPQNYAEAQRPQEPFRFVAECLIEAATEDATLDLKMQFLQLIRQHKDSSSHLETSNRSLSDPSLEWEEAIERTYEHQNLCLSDLIDSPLTLSVQMDASVLPNIVANQPLQAALTIEIKLLQSGARKIHLDVQNTSPLSSGTEVKRNEALPQSFVSAHILLGVNGGQFISLLDPPDVYRESATACNNIGVFPVLAGDEPARSVMLCSPIILYDYPKVAPESEGDFFDGTEMDEMLTLRVLTLTDAEKREMRNGDSRAQRILERTEALTAESMMKAHGIIRGMRDIRGGSQ